MDKVVRIVLLAIERQDREQLKPLLHPYLYWTRADGRIIRGRKNVLTALEEGPPSGPPAGYEVRDGQIYRWLEQPTR
jgi:hypothetical protein